MSDLTFEELQQEALENTLLIKDKIVTLEEAAQLLDYSEKRITELVEINAIEPVNNDGMYSLRVLNEGRTKVRELAKSRKEGKLISLPNCTVAEIAAQYNLTPRRVRQLLAEWEIDPIGTKRIQGSDKPVAVYEGKPISLAFTSSQFSKVTSELGQEVIKEGIASVKRADSMAIALFNMMTFDNADEVGEAVDEMNAYYEGLGDALEDVMKGYALYKIDKNRKERILSKMKTFKKD